MLTCWSIEGRSSFFFFVSVGCDKLLFQGFNVGHPEVFNTYINVQ